MDHNLLRKAAVGLDHSELREAAAFRSAPAWLKAAAAFGVAHTSLRGAAFGAKLVSRQLRLVGQHWAQGSSPWGGPQ